MQEALGAKARLLDQLSSGAKALVNAAAAPCSELGMDAAAADEAAAAPPIRARGTAAALPEPLFVLLGELLAVRHVYGLPITVRPLLLIVQRKPVATVACF